MKRAHEGETVLVARYDGTVESFDRCDGGGGRSRDGEVDVGSSE